MKLRKTLALITALFTLSSLAACGGSDGAENALSAKPAPADAAETTSSPDPAVADSPDIPRSAEIQEPPEDADVTLLAEDAYFTSDEYMILEPDSPPYNIGGWIAYGSAVWMDVDIPAGGLYEIGLYYSRAYTEATIEGTLEFQHDADDIVKITFDLSKPTSAEPGDWSVYTYKKIAECELEPGLHTFGIYPGTDGGGMTPGEHFINLRSVLLTAAEEYDDNGGDDDVDDDVDFGDLTQE